MAEMEKDGQGSEGGPLASGGILIQDLTYFPATLILRSRCRSDLPPGPSPSSFMCYPVLTPLLLLLLL